MCCRLTWLLSHPPTAMMPIDTTSDQTITTYALVTPAALILMGDDDALVAVDAHWTTQASCN